MSTAIPRWLKQKVIKKVDPLQKKFNLKNLNVILYICCTVILSLIAGKMHIIIAALF